MTDEELGTWHASLRDLQVPATLGAFLKTDSKRAQKDKAPEGFNAEEYS